MTELATRDEATAVAVAAPNLAQWLQEAQAADQLARGLIASNWVPAEYKKQGEAAAVANATGAILFGWQLGFNPVQSLQNIHMINGRPAMAADMMVALAVAAGHRIWTVERSEERAVVRGRRRDWTAEIPDAEITVTMDQAKRAGWTKNPAWQSDPAGMLNHRADKRIAQEIAPELMSGLLSIDEAREVQPEAEAPVRVTASTVLAEPKAVTAPAVDGLAPAAYLGRPVEDVSLPPLPGEEPAPPAEVEEPVKPVSRAQLKHLADRFTTLEVTDPAEGLAVLSVLVDRPVTASKDLTTDEARLVLDNLTAQVVEQHRAQAAQDQADYEDQAGAAEQLPDPADGNDPWAGADA